MNPPDILGHFDSLFKHGNNINVSVNDATTLSWDSVHSGWCRWTEHLLLDKVWHSGSYSQNVEVLQEVDKKWAGIKWSETSFTNLEHLALDQVAHSPCTVILPSVLALPAELVAKHMYCPESSAVMLSKMSVQEPSGSSMMMWWGSASTARPSVCETDGWITLLLRRHQEGKHQRFGSLPLYQVTCGLGAPVTLQASFTVCPSCAV